MPNSLITHLQIFGIGFSFAVAGPCLLVCTPILATYAVSRDGKWREAVRDVAAFLFGRLLAYVVLGAVAGLSGYYLRRLVEMEFAPYLNLASGAISVLLGVFIVISRKAPACTHSSLRNRIYGSGGVFAIGFLMGISPCGPLTALLFEIALISKSAMEGALYALSFGLGTFLAGIVIIGAFTGILKGFFQKVFHSKMSGNVFRMSCAILLILFGLGLIWTGVKGL